MGGGDKNKKVASPNLCARIGFVGCIALSLLGLRGSFNRIYASIDDRPFSSLLRLTYMNGEYDVITDEVKNDALPTPFESRRDLADTEAAASFASQAAPATLLISIISNNRLASLERLCASLLSADYTGSRDFFASIDLVFNMEANSEVPLTQFAMRLSWPHGSKQVRKRLKQGGLVTAVSESWFPSSYSEYGLILEDDIEVSPLYLQWVIKALALHRRNRDPRLVGISLYSPRITETSNPKRVFDSNQLLREITGDHESPYLMQTPCSWGAVYFPEHWHSFLGYMQLRLESPEEQVVVPNSRTNGWSESWKRFHFEYLYLKGLYLIYPNFLGQASFSTNHMEPGTHIVKKNGKLSHSEEDFKVPLLKSSESLQRLTVSSDRRLSEQLPVFDIFGDTWSFENTFSVYLTALQSNVTQTKVINDTLTAGSTVTPSSAGLFVESKVNYDRTKFALRVNDGALELVRTVGNNAESEWKSAGVIASDAHYKKNNRYSLSMTTRGSLRFERITERKNKRGMKTSVVWASPETAPVSSKDQPILRLETSGNLIVYLGEPGSCSKFSIVWLFNKETLSTAGSRCPDHHHHSKKTTNDAAKKCAAFPVSVNSYFKDLQSFTLMISTFDRFELLAKQLSYYSASPVVSTIIVIWHNNAIPPPKHGVIRGTYVRFEVPTTDTLNNRFVPLPIVTTEGIMVLDDDMKIHLQDLANLFEAWKHNPRSVVGFIPRWVDRVKYSRENATQELVYRSQSEDPEMGSFPNKQPHKGYSLILTKALMVHRDILRLYTCGGESTDLRIRISSKFDEMRSAIHRIVDASLNCEDIGLNFVANAALYSLGKAAPLYVQSLHKMGDFGKVQYGKGGLHQRKSHMGGRDQCLNQINREFARVAKANLPLQKQFVAASRVDDSTTLLKMERYRDHRERLHEDCTSWNGPEDGPCSWIVPADLTYKSIYKSA